MLKLAGNPSGNHDKLIAADAQANLLSELLNESPVNGLPAKVQTHQEKKL